MAALEGVSPERLRAAELYVTLEPCNVRGGRVPPCADALAASGLARVVYGVEDVTLPRPRGAEIIGGAGVSVGTALEESLAWTFVPFFWSKLFRRTLVVPIFIAPSDVAGAVRCQRSTRVWRQLAKGAGSARAQAEALAALNDGGQPPRTAFKSPTAEAIADFCAQVDAFILEGHGVDEIVDEVLAVAAPHVEIFAVFPDTARLITATRNVSRSAKGERLWLVTAGASPEEPPSCTPSCRFRANLVPNSEDVEDLIHELGLSLAFHLFLQTEAQQDR
eukprot:Polyplicarium_translucidae@DN1169_c0_g1_i2.p1